MGTYAVQMEKISKAFNGIPVLREVDFNLIKGEVHALVGGNGAGKSTLMKILEGVYTPDSGNISIFEEEVLIPNPRVAQNLGIGMVFQEFSLISTLTVSQNIFLTNEPQSGTGLLNDLQAENLTRDLFYDLGVDIDPHAQMDTLSTGYWQLTEIAKALSRNAKILIMDEPTASLTVSETQFLFDLVRKLKSNGISIIYISHRMEEIFQIADRITVLRDGQSIITESTKDITISQVIEHIVGRKMGEAFSWKERSVDLTGTPLFEVKNLRSGTRVQDINFEVHPGEILGLAGLMGSGRTELVRALFGIDPIQSGEVWVEGKKIQIKQPQDALEAGICLIPEDRRAQGLVLDHSVKDNMLLPLLRSIQKNGLINDEAGDKLVKTYIDNLSIKTDSIEKIIRFLSGGNQQKVVIAKWLAYNPKILLMDEPTAGVDIGAKTEILNIIRKLADEGKAIVVISSEFPELLAVADRVLIVRNGTVKLNIDRKEIETEEFLHHAVQRTTANEIVLSEKQLDQIRSMQATAAILMHYSGDEWSSAQIAGINSQFEKMGINVIAVTDADFNPTKQVADIKSVIALKPDVIISIPTDPVATADAYLEAAEQGIKMVFMDNIPKGFRPGTDYISMVSADNYGNGVAAAHIMAKQLGNQGKIGLIYHNADFFATQQRYQGFKKTIIENYKDIEIVAEFGVSDENLSGDAENATLTMMREIPDLDGVWAVWDVPAEGVISALRKEGRSDIVVTTEDLGLNVAVELAKDGYIKGLGAQRPFDQGVTEALLAGYGLLGLPAPNDVVLNPFAVTHTNVLEAWKIVYHQDPPQELISAIK